MDRSILYDSFLIRIHQAAVSDSDNVWQGEINHIQGGTQHKFELPKELLAYLEKQIEQSHTKSTLQRKDS